MIWILAALFFGSSAQAFEVGGKLGHSYFQAIEDQPEKVIISRSSAELELDHDLKGRMRTLVRPRVDWIQESTLPSENQEKKALGEMREVFLQFQRKSFQFTAGKRIESWGSSDILNPTDYFGAKDQTRWSADNEDRRLGVSGFFASWSTPVMRKYTFSVETVAAFTGLESEPLIVRSMPVTGISFEGRYKASQPGFGLRTRFEADTWDFSLSGFHGQSHEPEFQYLGVGPNGQRLALIHQRMNAFGFDGSATAGKWIFRSEGAYRAFEYREGFEPLLEPDRSEIVLGVERPIGESFRVHAQYFIRQKWGVNEKPIGNTPQEIVFFEGIKTSNELLYGFVDNQEQGVTVRGTWLLFDERLQAQAVGIYLFDSDSSLFRPSLQWSGFDHFLLTAGALVHSGADTTSLGRLKPFNSYFGEIQFVF